MIQGHVELGFEPVAEAVLSQTRRSGGGAAACVYHHGRKVVDVWAGTRDDSGRPWTADTMAMSFSTSKGVLATLIHILADRGLLDYDAPVARYWPEFAQGGKAEIRVRELLSHQAGLPGVRGLVDRGDRILDWEYMVRALERARPIVRPGSRSAYHAFTFGWLAGELAQRVGGRPLGEMLQTELVEPLGLDGLYIGAPADARARAARLPTPRVMQSGGRVTELLGRAPGVLSRVYKAAGVPVDPALMREALMPPDASHVLFGPRILEAVVPAANGLFTARSLARIYAMLAAGGSLDGVRLLSERTIRRASEIQTHRPDRVLVLPMHWRLGYHSAFTTRGRLAGAFGHFGYGGSGAFADPRRRLAVAMVNNRAGGGPFGDARLALLTSAVLRSARRTRGIARPLGSQFAAPA